MRSPDTQQRSKRGGRHRRPWQAPARFLRAFFDDAGSSMAAPADFSAPPSVQLPPLLQRAPDHGGAIPLEDEPAPARPSYLAQLLRLLRVAVTWALVGGLLGLTAVLSVVVVPRTFGYQALVVHGGSMGSEMPNGSLVLTRQLAAGDVAVGDVILIHESTEPGPAAPKIHRVESLWADGDNIVVRTRGDANQSADSMEYILPARVATPVITLVHIGRIAGFVATPTGWALFVLLPALFVATVIIHGIWFPPIPAAQRVPRTTVYPLPWIGSLLALGISGAILVPVAASIFTEAPGVAGNTLASDTLNAPSSLNATGGASVGLSWTATTDTYAAGHRVLRSGTAGGPYSQIAEVTPRTTATYNDAPSTGTYYYVVRAYYQSWESANSNEASATVAGGPTYYLHNNPTPPVGNTASQQDLPFNTTAPTATTLYNYDTDRDSFAGRLILKGGTGASETDATKYQNWRTSALGSPLSISGTVTFNLWSAIKDFRTNKTGSITAYLRDYNGSSYTEVCNGALTQSNWQGGSGTWVLKTLSFSCASYTIPAGNRLELKLIVNAGSEDDMWFAYDTTAYDSRLNLP